MLDADVLHLLTEALGPVEFLRASCCQAWLAVANGLLRLPSAWRRKSPRHIVQYDDGLDHVANKRVEAAVHERPSHHQSAISGSVDHVTSAWILS